MLPTGGDAADFGLWNLARIIHERRDAETQR